MCRARKEGSRSNPESMVVLVMFQLKSKAAICARMGAGFIEVDKDFRVTERSIASVASCDPGLGQPNWLLSNHFHCAERLGLKMHGRLFEAGASRWSGPRTLVF